MEEDIKILEQFLKANNRCVGCEEKCNDCYIEYEEVQAVANLIKGYRELEEHITFYEKNGSYKKRIIELKEENKELKEQVEYLKHEVVLHGSTVEKLVREKMNSIPKSKIKEKIEELEHEKFKRTYLGFFPKNNCENRILLAKIQALQKLMEDK